MFTNLQIRTSKPSHRKSGGFTARGAIAKRRVSLVPASTASNVPSLSFMENLFGDEFPEAFSNGETRLKKSRKCFSDLPAELLAVICDYLSKLDIKRLRLTSKQIALNVNLRLERVYISPNRANLNCLQRILEHSRYRKCVREIVWDDAQLEEYVTLDSFRDALSVDERKTMRDVERRLDEAMEDCPDDGPEYPSLDEDDFFSDDGKLTDVAKGILLETNDRVSRDIIARNAALMSIEESYLLYQRLYQEEQDLIKLQVDIKALHRALADFPNLHRITLTSEVWRPWNLYPEYDTPFYRSLPPGFRKPSVWPWLGPRIQSTPSQDAYRNKIMSERHIDWLSDDWRGYGIIVSALLNMRATKIDEFIIDAGNERTGLSHQLFSSANQELERTVRMFRNVPLKRFHLALNPHGSITTGTAYLSANFIERTLSVMRHLEHLDFNPNLQCRRQRFCAGFFEVRSVMPDDLVKRLRTFNLRNMPVFQDDLITLLTSMPVIEKITLDNISLMERHFSETLTISWENLFWKLREAYSDPTWHTTRPRYTWIDPISDQQENDSHHCRFLDDEIDAYLYCGGDALFYHHTNRLTDGMGWIVDERDKEYRVRLWERAGEMYLD